MFGFTKKFITTIAMLFTIFTVAAAPAGAIEDSFLPGGNGPDIDPPIDIGGITAIPVTPQASVEISCTDETATARIENNTGNFHTFGVTVDGDWVGGGITVKDGLNNVEFPLAENETAAVVIEVDNDVLFDEEVTRDCLLPDPSYQLLEDCDGGQAHVRLINNGDDTANMAVQYEGVPYVLQPVAPHSSIDWLLAVDPGDFAYFTVKFGHDVDLGAESFTFSCPEEPVTPTEPATPVEPVTPPEPATPVEPVTPPEPATPVEPATPNDAEPIEPVAPEENDATNEGIVEVQSGNGQELEADGTDGDTGDDVEELASGSEDGFDDKSSGLPFGKLAAGGFSFLLVLALAAAILYSERRQEMHTA